MTFLFPFLNFLQPGIFIPPLAAYKPMLVASLLAGIYGVMRSKPGDSELRRQYFTHPIFILMCIFIAVQCISVYASGLTSIKSEFDYWNVYALFVCVSLLTIHDAASLRRYVWGVMIGASWVVVFGLLSVAFQLPNIVGGRAGAYGMYENHNDYTFAIIMVLPFLYLSMRMYRSKMLKLILFALVVSCVAGVMLSLSRGGMLALVLEFGLLFWLTLTGKKRVLAFMVVGIIGSGATVYLFAARAENQAGQYTEADAKNSRYELWRAARNMFTAHPILGVGSRRFHEYSQDYGEISHDNRGKVAHNTYIEVAADTGLLGLGSFLGMLFCIYRATRGGRLSQATGDGIVDMQVAALVALGSIMFRSLLDAKAHDWSFYVLAVVAIATSVLAAQKSPVSESVPASRGSEVRKPSRLSARPAVYLARH